MRQIACGDDVRYRHPYRGLFAGSSPGALRQRSDAPANRQNGFNAFTTPAPRVQRVPAPPASVTTATAPSAAPPRPSAVFRVHFGARIEDFAPAACPQSCRLAAACFAPARSARPAIPFVSVRAGWDRSRFGSAATPTFPLSASRPIARAAAVGRRARGRVPRAPAACESALKRSRSIASRTATANADPYAAVPAARCGSSRRAEWRRCLSSTRANVPRSLIANRRPRAAWRRARHLQVRCLARASLRRDGPALRPCARDRK